jgi:hypothetical protein
LGYSAKAAPPFAAILIAIGLPFLVTPLAAQQQQAVASDHDEGASTLSETPPPKDDRIFEVMPNFETVEGAPTAPPLSIGEKWKLTTQSAFDPFEFALSGMLAGISQAENSQSSYGQGAAGYGKRYAEAFANQSIGNFMSGAVFPTLLREDPRYFQLGKGSFGHRFGYALSRIFVTPTDAGHMQFNYSEFLGNASAAGIADAYNSPNERTAADTAGNFGEQIAIDMMGNELREFWPDIRRKFFRKP